MNEAAAPGGVPGTAVSGRGKFLSTIAVLIVLLGISNFTKPLQNMADPTKGLVLLGMRLETVVSNAVLGPLCGLVLFAYAYGIWKMKRWVLPLAIAYAFYVPVNLVLFWFLHHGLQPPPVAFIVAYLAVALTGSVGTALCLAYHREQLS
ncbi:MAG: hypothetical protein ACE5I7_20155, partial [Candidatus Binatia bacterium]